MLQMILARAALLRFVPFAIALLMLPASIALHGLNGDGLLPICNGFMVANDHTRTGMGIDKFGHTRLSEARRVISMPVYDRTRTLVAQMRAELAQYQDYRSAINAGFELQGEDVPVGQLKHFFNYKNFQQNQAGLDPRRPAAILYRRTADGYQLAGEMFTAPIDISMRELDKRIPLALGHWHSHRNICVPQHGVTLKSETDRNRFGFSGSIATASACANAGGVFLDNVYGWMIHVYPFETGLQNQFGG